MDVAIDKKYIREKYISIELRARGLLLDVQDDFISIILEYRLKRKTSVISSELRHVHTQFMAKNKNDLLCFIYHETFDTRLPKCSFDQVQMLEAPLIEFEGVKCPAAFE